MSDENKKKKKKHPEINAKTTKEQDEATVIGIPSDHQVTLVKSQSSVLLKDDGKGKLSYEIKSYADTIDEAVIKVLEAKKQLDKKLGFETPSKGEK